MQLTDAQIALGRRGRRNALAVVGLTAVGITAATTLLTRTPEVAGWIVSTVFRQASQACANLSAEQEALALLRVVAAGVFVSAAVVYWLQSRTRPLRPDFAGKKGAHRVWTMHALLALAGVAVLISTAGGRAERILPCDTYLGPSPGMVVGLVVGLLLLGVCEMLRTVMFQPRRAR